MAWTCPACDRTFGRTRQSHTCVPVVSLDDWFADRPPAWREVCDAVLDHLTTLGEVDAEAAEVGILFKAPRTFAELRPHRRRDLRLSVILDHDVDSPRISRRIRPGQYKGFDRYCLYAVLEGADDVDDEVRGWLTESWSLYAPP